MHISVRFLFALCSLASFESAFAAPAQITQTQFKAALAGGVLTIETFQGIPAVGPVPSPLSLTNGIYTGTPQVDSAPWCEIENVTNVCMDIAFSDGMFSQFPAGTQLWGATIYYASPGDQLQVTVSARDGVTVFTLPAGQVVPDGTFVGFFDATGITSVAIHRVNPFGANLAFDNISTGSFAISSAPMLSNWLLAIVAAVVLFLGCAGIRLQRRTT